jgi:hypothetical protein
VGNPKHYNLFHPYEFFPWPQYSQELLCVLWNLTLYYQLATGLSVNAILFLTPPFFSHPF